MAQMCESMEPRLKQVLLVPVAAQRIRAFERLEEALPLLQVEAEVKHHHLCRRQNPLAVGLDQIYCRLYKQ
jgi:hypothetical protein